jgi:hypothetical protein
MMRYDASGERSGVEWSGHMWQSPGAKRLIQPHHHTVTTLSSTAHRECVCACVTWRTLAVTDYRERLVALLRYAINPLRCGGVHEVRLPAPSQLSLFSLVVLGDGEER